MSKKVKSASALNGATTAVNAETGEKVIVVPADFKLKPGRPANPNSERQKRLKELEARRAEGAPIKRGRPAVPGSANSLKKAAQEARKLENGGVAHRGRPVDPNSPRQIQLREKAERMKQLYIQQQEMLKNQNNG